MKQMENGTEEKTQNSWREEDKNGPFGYELRIGCLRVKIHGHKNIGVKIVFEMLCLSLYFLDEGKVKLISNGWNNMRRNSILILLFKLLYFSEFIFQLFLQGAFNSFDVLVEQFVEIVRMLIYFDYDLVILLNYLGGNWRMLQTWIAVIHVDIFES